MATNLVARYLALKPAEIEDHTKNSLEWFKDNLRQIRLTEAGRKGLLAKGRPSLPRPITDDFISYFLIYLHL